VGIEVINFEEKFAKFSERFSPKIIAQMNDYHFKLTRTFGDFVWHKHPETDETFIVIDGKLQIDLRDKSLHLKPGDMVVIPKGVEHKPYANEECKVLLIEPAGAINTGDAGGELTKSEFWI